MDLGRALAHRLWFPAPEGFTYCAEEGKEGKTKQNKKGETTTELRQRSSRNSSLPYSPTVFGERLSPSGGSRRLGAQRSSGAPGAEEGARRARPTYHDCGRGRGCLGGYRGLVGLVLRSFDFGLQVCRRVKIFAFLPHATPLYVIHTNGYGVVICVDHGAVCGVCKAAVGLSPGTVSSLELPAYLGHMGNKSRQCRRKPDGRRKPPLQAQPFVFCIFLVFCFFKKGVNAFSFF